jgi:hypothetical protein
MIMLSFQRVQEERFEPLSIGDTTTRLMKCEKVSLDFYKSKQQKLDLLDAAVASLCDDVILVVSFMRRLS